MKNYIANERGDWATSAGFVKYSIARSIHFGRLYLGGGSHEKGREEHLSEALRCLGQGKKAPMLWLVIFTNISSQNRISDSATETQF